MQKWHWTYSTHTVHIVIIICRRALTMNKRWKQSKSHWYYRCATIISYYCIIPFSLVPVHYLNAYFVHWTIFRMKTFIMVPATFRSMSDEELKLQLCAMLCDVEGIILTELMKCITIYLYLMVSESFLRRYPFSFKYKSGLYLFYLIMWVFLIRNYCNYYNGYCMLDYFYKMLQSRGQFPSL